MSRNRRTVAWGLALAGLLLGVLCAGSVWAGKTKKTEKKVTIDQVPAAVKATILKEAGSNKITEIEEISVDGKVVCFEAEWKLGDKEVEIKVAPNGKLLKKKIEVDDDDDDDDDDD